MLKRGMSRIGAVQLTVSGLARAFRLTVTNETIWVGILFLTGFMLHDGAELGGLQLRDAGRRIWIRITHFTGGRFSARAGFAPALGGCRFDLSGGSAGGTNETKDDRSS